MADEEVVQEQVETPTEPQGEVPPTPEEQAPAETEEFSLDNPEGLERVLEGAQTRKAASKDLIERYVKSDPEMAHFLKSLIGDHRKKSSSVAEDRRKLEEERVRFQADQKKAIEEMAKFRTAIMSSNLKFDDIKPGETDPLPEVDYTELLADPKGFVARLRAEVKSDLLKELPNHLKPYTEPLQRLHAETQRQASQEAAALLKAEYGDDWSHIKGRVVEILKSNPSIDSKSAASIAYGEFSRTQRAKATEQRRTVDRTQLAAATVVGRGGTGKAPITFKPSKTTEDFTKQYQDLLSAGYSEDEILEAAQKNYRVAR